MIDSIRSLSVEVVDSMAHAASLVETVVKRAVNASEAIKKIGQGSQHAATMIEEITSAIKAQSQASNSIAWNVESIAQMAEQSSAAAQNSAESALGPDQLAQEKSRVVAAYRV